MDTTFLFNKTSTPFQIKDAINNRLIKTRAIITCAMFAIEFLKGEIMQDGNTTYHVLWAADDMLKEIEMLQNVS